MKITNNTHWQTRDLRRIATRVVREELPRDRFGKRAKNFTVIVGYNRSADRGTYSSGHAYYHTNYFHVNVPSGAVDPVDFAYVLGHEIGHCKGLKHGHMAPHHGDGTAKRSDYSIAHYAWALDMPIRKVEPKRKARPTVDQKLEHARTMLRKAETRAKRASTLLKKWQRKIRTLERKGLAMAACPKGE